MKIARYRIGEQVSYGIVEGDTVRDITASPFEDYQVTDRTHPLSQVKLLPPTTPRNLLTTGVNTESHSMSAQNLASPRRAANTNPYRDRKEPTVSIRNITSMVGHEDQVIRPRETLDLSFREECELVVVIGKQCKRVTGDDIFNYVFGYTIGNDFTVKEWEYVAEAWKAKCCDTMHPIGPWIETDLDPTNVTLRAQVNGVETQGESTANYRFSVPDVVGTIVRHMTLYPGDMVFMGTCGEPADCKVGDTVELSIDGIGTLRNYIVAEE